MRVAERAFRLPALRYRVEAGGRSALLTPPPVADHHVFAVDLPGDKDATQAAESMLSRPLPPAPAPTWDVWLIRRARGSHTLCFRIDHVLLDGTGACRIARDLLEDQPAPAGALPRLHTPRPVRARGMASACKDVALAMRPPRLGPAFSGQATGVARLAHTDVPLRTLRTIGRNLGATINDVHLGALALAVGRLHRQLAGEPHPAVRVSVPLSIRTPERADAPLNDVVSSLLTLPCDAVSPLQALTRVTAQTARLRESGHRDAARLLLAAVPLRLAAAFGARVASVCPVAMDCSNVNVGPALLHQGARATHGAIVTPLIRNQLCHIALTGYDDTARLTVLADDALTGADGLGEHWLAALHDLADYAR
ncbi:WS/DGAT domain-containing protein [Streptomyces sp. DH12]|uniref:WS/DGAT domain-containing protein n=1 Tax=Streptomyces sp. DH12 TaxID=2857010 RepID=UPI001E426AFD|nr:WS/DGAT domain-containing protein [Streptomyces sp. DH12]